MASRRVVIIITIVVVMERRSRLRVWERVVKDVGERVGDEQESVVCGVGVVKWL